MSHLRAVPDDPTGPRESSAPPRSGSASSSITVEPSAAAGAFSST